MSDEKLAHQIQLSEAKIYQNENKKCDQLTESSKVSLISSPNTTKLSLLTIKNVTSVQILNLQIRINLNLLTKLIKNDLLQYNFDYYFLGYLRNSSRYSKLSFINTKSTIF